MGKKNKGKRKGALRTKLKTERKAEKKERRAMERYDEDLDAVLAEIAEHDKRTLSEESVTRPSRRSNCTVVAHPSNDNTSIFFGGEDTQEGNHIYHRDVLFYRNDKNIWRRFSDPAGPLPRCSHQCVPVRFGGRDLMYTFGGEYSTPDGDKFRHFKDLWVFDLESHTWHEVHQNSRNQPSARSGHRMALWKKCLVLFGGFFDAYEQPCTKYYNDLWLFDLEQSEWRKITNTTSELLTDTAVPSPRSGCQLAVYGDTLYVFGGYTQIMPEPKKKSSSGRKGRDDDDSDDDEPIGVTLDDVWCINLAAEKADQRWEQVRTGNHLPAPRAGFSLVTFKKRALVFGGVTDSSDGDRPTSTFLDDAWWFSFERRAWSPLRMKGIKQDKDQPPAAAQVDTAPLPRFKPQAVLLGSSKMIIYGGMVEVKSKEYTHDDMYLLDLNKLDGWRVLLPPAGLAVPTAEAKDKKVSDSGSSDSDSEASDTESDSVPDDSAPQADTVPGPATPQ
eukprot:TRINITY_DN18862_c0_g1_i1.p1 TRINITY_DN18862_c0_g1~~TRINITY_DN18862_c0_g1_i1.p1  ORF type:complete len:501 (+),score=132.20 TRINITY_DN18862_c0_g1_i1:50-1552(+)